MKKQSIHRLGGYLLGMAIVCLAASGMAQTSASSAFQQPSVLAEEKDPLLAFACSALIPGLGQYYNGDIAKGVIQEVFVLGGFVFAIAKGIEEKETTYYYGGYFDYTETETDITGDFWIGLGVSAGAYIWSVIDAPLSAMHKNNQRRKKSYGHLFEYESRNYSAGLDLKMVHSTVGLQLALHF